MKKVIKAQLGISTANNFNYITRTPPALISPIDSFWTTPYLKDLFLTNLSFNSGGSSKSSGGGIAARLYVAGIGALLGSEGINYLAGQLGNNIGGNLGNIFSSGLSSAGNTVFSNIVKKQDLLHGMSQNVGESLAGTGVGLAANGIGQGINSIGGNSMLSRGIGQGVATGLGSIGGAVVNNLFKGSNLLAGLSPMKDAALALSNAIRNALNSGASEVAAREAGSKAFNASRAASTANLAGLGMSVVGAGLSAAFGPSKEYNGKYGHITKGMDTAYDIVQGAAGFVPGAGTLISGAMALNKGLSNVFGSTDAMTKQDAILGSAWMPAPVKWLNMAGASKTGAFGNLSWLNSEKTKSFMGNAFGNLYDKFDTASTESNKIYGTFSLKAKRKANDRINFANNAWNKILAMADQNELQNIRSEYMTSINNLRYAQQIGGGFNPLYVGRQGMKILNNATNHNMALRLLSGAALIDSKQMILCNVPD